MAVCVFALMAAAGAFTPQPASAVFRVVGQHPENPVATGEHTFISSGGGNASWDPVEDPVRLDGDARPWAASIVNVLGDQGACDLFLYNIPPPNPPPNFHVVEQSFLTSFITSPPEILDITAGQNLDIGSNADHRRTFQFRIYALREQCNDLTALTIATCIKWRVTTDGAIHASPRFGIVNVESLFWMEGVLSQPHYSVLLTADPANLYWNNQIASDGIYLNANEEVTYTRNNNEVKIPCTASGGLIDTTHPNGLALSLAKTIFAGANGLQLSTSTYNLPVDPVQNDVNSDGVYNDESSDVDINRGVVQITRSIQPQSLRQQTTIDFGPWQWDFDGDGKGDDLTLTVAPASPFDQLIASDDAIGGLGDTSATTQDLEDAIRTFPGARSTFEKHGIYNLGVWVDRTLRAATDSGGMGSVLKLRVTDTYTWTERWPTTLIYQHIGNRSGPTQTGWAYNGRCSAAAGSSCDSATNVRNLMGAESWNGPATRDDSYWDKDTIDCPSTSPPGETCYGPQYYVHNIYTYTVARDCQPDTYYYYPDTGSGSGHSLCGYGNWWDEYQHTFHAYWACVADIPSPDITDHGWYNPRGGSRRTSIGADITPNQPSLGFCEATHTYPYTRAPLVSKNLPKQNLSTVLKAYEYHNVQGDRYHTRPGNPRYDPQLPTLDMTDPGTNNVRLGYPVKRRFPVLVDER